MQEFLSGRWKNFKLAGISFLQNNTRGKNYSIIRAVIIMATMIPDIEPSLIENSGEQRFYEAARELPAASGVY